MRLSLVVVAVVLIAVGGAVWINWPKDCACLPLIEKDGVVIDAGVAASPECLC